MKLHAEGNKEASGAAWGLGRVDERLYGMHAQCVQKRGVHMVPDEAPVCSGSANECTGRYSQRVNGIRVSSGLAPPVCARDMDEYG